MKLSCIALVAFCGLSASVADAATWVKAIDSKTSRIFVDTSSINRTGGIVAAWYRRDFNHPMPAEKKAQLYKSSKVLNYYNCSDHEVAPAQWITYENRDGLGKIISNEKVVALEYGEVPSGEAGAAVFDFVCHYAKSRRT